MNGFDEILKLLEKKRGHVNKTGTSEDSGDLAEVICIDEKVTAEKSTTTDQPPIAECLVCMEKFSRMANVLVEHLPKHPKAGMTKQAGQTI